MLITVCRLMAALIVWQAADAPTDDPPVLLGSDLRTRLQLALKRRTHGVTHVLRYVDLARAMR